MPPHRGATPPAEPAVDAARDNARLDADLRATGEVSRELYLRLSAPHGYGAASTVGWVGGRLRVLASRLAAGAPLALYAPGADRVLPCRSLREFEAWAAAGFADADLTRRPRGD